MAFDACRAQGDDAAAEALCEHSLVAAEDEVQAIARRAEFWLSKRVHDASTWSRKFIALSRLPSALGARQSVSELPLGAHTWDGARVIALAERATAWLDAATAPDAPPLHDPDVAPKHRP